MKKLLMLAALAAVVLAGTVYGEADTRRDGTKFNPAQSPVRLYLVRTVDSTGTKAGRRDSVAWSNVVGQLPVPQTVGGVYDADTSSRAFRATNEGYLYILDANPPITTAVSSGIDGVTIAAGGTASSQPECVDLSAYSKVTLLLSWTTAAAADSDSVQIALKVFNKESAAWGTNDTQVFPLNVVRTAAVLDTTMTEPSLNLGGSIAIPPPTLYVYRSTALTATLGGVKTTINGLGTLARLKAGNGGVAIDLTGLCGAMNHVGLQVTNWHVTDSLVNFKAVFLCRR